MQFNHPTVILGMATAAILSPVLMSEQAVAATFTVKSGVTSVLLDTNLLEAAAGLTLTGASGVADPSPELPGGVGFSITPATDFTFDFDSATGSFVPVSGTIEHSGTVTFNDVITVGDFSIGFDAARAVGSASGFFVADTVGGLGILFDISAPGTLNVTDEALTIADTNLLVSPEFAATLQSVGLADADLTGADVGDARVDAETVPEPSLTMALLATGIAFVVGRKRSVAHQA